MAEAFLSDRRKELEILLDRVRTQPSAVGPGDRERIFVLRNLIAGSAPAARDQPSLK